MSNTNSIIFVIWCLFVVFVTWKPRKRESILPLASLRMAIVKMEPGDRIILRIGEDCPIENPRIADRMLREAIREWLPPGTPVLILWPDIEISLVRPSVRYGEAPAV
jgi:hypothetical protein